MHGVGSDTSLDVSVEQANWKTGLESSVQSGVVAYAHKQSILYLQMAACCATHCLPVMKNHEIIPSWGSMME